MHSFQFVSMTYKWIDNSITTSNYNWFVNIWNGTTIAQFIFGFVNDQIEIIVNFIFEWSD